MSQEKWLALFSTVIHLLEFGICFVIAYFVAQVFPETREIVITFVGGTLLAGLAKFVRADKSNDVPDYVNQ